MARSARIERNTLETQITVSIELDGSGMSRLETGVPFLEHMLDQIARHGLVDLDIAARDCMVAIGEHHLNQAVLRAAERKPFLGICMGLQVLMRHSEENGGTALLGLYQGEVRRFEGLPAGDNGLPLKIPHMGWSPVHQVTEHPLWADIPDDSRFYFVHSYRVVPEDVSLIAATTDYGVRFTSAIARDNLFATQFHPEKSADIGLQLLKNFVNWDI